MHLAPDILLNPRLNRTGPYDERKRTILSIARGQAAWDAIAGWPGYAATPLRSLVAMARETGVAEVVYKDEGFRFGLKSFKALGGAYAVEHLARAGAGRPLVVTCPTDGNHGRAVAWGASRAGARAIIYVHEGVSPGRVEAIAAFGADVVRAGRTYDESVRLCAAAAAANGWQLVSDTSWPGYEDVPATVMQGYAVTIAEALEQGPPPTHVFVQAGVGGLAASVLAWLWELLGPERPIFVVVEPEQAACLFASAAAGEFRVVDGDLDTIMAGLACGEPSLLAWKILADGVDAFMRIPDAAAEAAMRQLSDIGVVSGESGVAGLAAFRSAAGQAQARAALRLNATSRVLCIGTEGATDRAVYVQLTGRQPEDVGTGGHATAQTGRSGR